MLCRSHRSVWTNQQPLIFKPRVRNWYSKSINSFYDTRVMNMSGLSACIVLKVIRKSWPRSWSSSQRTAWSAQSLKVDRLWAMHEKLWEMKIGWDGGWFIYTQLWDTMAYICGIGWRMLLGYQRQRYLCLRYRWVENNVGCPWVMYVGCDGTGF